MSLKKLLRLSIFFTSGLLIANTSYAITGNGTPTQYNVTLSQIEFHKVGDPSTTFITYASGSGQFDIAGVLPNNPVGVLTRTGNLPSGSYDQIRVTISKTMQLKGVSSSTLANGKFCRTTSSGVLVSNPFTGVDSAYTGVAEATPGTPGLETTAVPTGSGVTLPSGLTDLGTVFTDTIPVSFTVTGQVPKSTVKIDVTNAMYFQATDLNTCYVFPMPPVVTVTIV